jgi:hypothetical protein
MGGTHSGLTGHTGTTHTTTTSAPHGSNLANKLDPRVDSDNDHRGASTAGAYGSSHTAGSGSSVTGLGHPGGTGPASGTTYSHTTDHHHPPGGTVLNAGAAGNTSTQTHGPHRSDAANKIDPRVDSDRDHRANPSARVTGPAPNTAGPHKSDLLNKLDPRVDSDLDGSKTIGGDKTHAH